MSLTRRSTLHRVAAAALFAAGWALPAAAQEAWPAKPVRFVVPFAAGGSTDVIARMVAQKLSIKWGQPVIVENKLGAGGSVGADAVAKSTADGYTLLFHSGAVAINPHVYKRMPFDTEKDLLPVTNVAGGPMIIVVSDRSSIRTLKELIALARQQPGSVNFGSAGVGSQVHLAGENFARAAKIDVTHVPYKGEAIAFNDLIAGQLQMMVGNFAAASALLGPGRLRALAVTGKSRSPQLPDVPTAAEAGLPGFENTAWFGLFAPAGTPKDVVAKIQRDTAAMVRETDVKARLYVQGMQPIGNTSAEFAEQMRKESSHWAALVKERNLVAN
ncbi:MAG: tripartite tricarboxylate transporter substrate binding protein [Ramlibacter sp.]